MRKLQISLITLLGLSLGTSTSWAQFPGGQGFPQVPQQQGSQQPGVVPGGFRSSLNPGQSSTLMAYCADLTAGAPDGNTRLVADPGVGDVKVAGQHLSLLTAEQQGLILIRGHSDVLDGRRTIGQWLDFHLVNTSRYGIYAQIESGAVLTPAGQKRPEIDPGVLAMLNQEQQEGLYGKDESAIAMWGSRGSTAQDLAEETFRFWPTASIDTAQRLLDSAGIHKTFRGGEDSYRLPYEATFSALGAATRQVNLPLMLADGTATQALLTFNASRLGVAVIQPSPRSKGVDPAARLYYQARVAPNPTGFEVELIVPTTGRAVPGLPLLRYGPIP